METNQAAAPPVATPGAELQEVLKACGPDRLALEKQLKDLVSGLWKTFLFKLEEVLPHTKGDGSVNERLFIAYRNQVMTQGNAAERQLPMILQDYVIQQAFIRQVTTRVLPREGPWGLPRGVKHPSEKNKH